MGIHLEKPKIWQPIPLLVTLWQGCDSGGVLPRHAHEEFQIVLSSSVPSEFSYRRSNTILPPRHLGVIQSGEPHASRSEDSTGGGQGEPLLLLHGHPETWYAWRKIMPALAQRYTLIVPDMRGYGDSSKPETGYEKHIVAEDLHQLLQHLNVQRYYLAAYDMGVPVAYALAAAHSEQIFRFVAMESGVPGFGLEQAFDVAHGGEWHFGFFMAPEFPEMLTAGREREFLTAFAFRGKWVYQQDAIADADITEYVRGNGTRSGMRAGFAYYRAFPTDAQYNRETFKGKLKIPVLALGGDRSFGEAPFKLMQAVAEDVRGAVIQNCGHFIPEEQPEVLTQHILDFFREE